MDLVGFLETVYVGPKPDGSCFTVWSKQDQKLSTHISTAGPWTINALLEASNLVAKGQDAYFGVGLRRPGLAPSQRGGKGDVVALPGLWADIDLTSPGGVHAADNLPTYEIACELIDGCGFDPTIVVNSGFGIHSYWLFEKLLWVDPGDVGRIGAACKQLQQIIADAAAVRGLHVDMTANVDRVLRLPDTKNFKIASDPKQVRVLLSDGPRYDPRILVPGVARKRHLGTGARSASTPGSSASGEPLTDLQKKSLLAETVTRLRRLSNNANRKLMNLVLAGHPFAAPGSRDASLQKVASILAFVAPPGLDADTLVTLLVPSLVAMRDQADDEGNPAMTIEDAVDKLGRALGDAEREREREQRIRSALLGSLGGGPPGPTPGPTPGPADHGPGPGSSSAAASGDAPAASEDVDDSPSDRVVPGRIYTEDDLLKFAVDQGVAPEQFYKRWVIQHASAYYVYIDGRYRSPVTREALLVHLRDDLGRCEKLGVNLWTFKKDGEMRKRTGPELLDLYATGARTLKGSLLLDRSKFDEATSTFWEAVCPPRKIVPRFDPQIETWLHLLGGAEAESLLDWIATVTDLDRQSSALILSGRPGAGKTMLTAGLARLWTMGGPSELIDVVGSSFNADIARCPLVFGDEDMQCSTTDLRRLIGSSSHTLRRKYLPNVELEGALRVILADNGARMLRKDTDEEIAGDDLDAVSSKFLHIAVGEKPVEYLRNIGGRIGTTGWVDQDKIAAHALHLAQTRNVVSGNRFIVEGKTTSMMRMLAVQGRVPGLVCEWIVGFLDKPITNVFQQGTAIVGGGNILINVDAIENHWSTVIHSEPKPFSRTRLGKALTNLSRGTKRVGSRRYHDVRPDLIYEWSEINLVGDLSAIKARVDAPLSAELAAAIAASE